MQFSALYLAAAVPLTTDGTPDPQHYLCGTDASGSVLLHAQPGIAPIAPTVVIEDGSTAWTWGPVRLAHPELALFAVPHRWDAEPTDVDVTVADWPLLAPIKL